ncbi:MAG: hypothetical protein R6U19_00100 [Bacteroidales bacterium]
MTKKIEVLTEKIYKEGIQKAEEEREAIVKAAKEKAGQIEQEAQKKAKEVISDAEQKAEETKKHVEGEIKMSAEQAVSALKQDIRDLITMKAIEPSTKALFSNKKYLGSLIKQVIEGWKKKESTDLDIILPESNKKELETYFKNELAHQLNQGIELKFSSRLKKGFKIAPVNSSYQINFTEEDFNNFFKTYLRPKTNEMLFKEK